MKFSFSIQHSYENTQSKLLECEILNLHQYGILSKEVFFHASMLIDTIGHNNNSVMV